MAMDDNSGWEPWGLPFSHGRGTEDGIDWFARSPYSHHPASRSLPQEDQVIERQRNGQQLLRNRRFATPCARDALTLCVRLETAESARRLVTKTQELVSGMHDLESMLLESFIDKDYDDDLLLLTATEGDDGKLLGMVFWRYLREIDDLFWDAAGVDWKKKLGSQIENACICGKPFRDAWVVIELLCIDEACRGHGIGKLLLVAALAYSAVKDGKTAAVLSLGGGGGSTNQTAKALYERLGFQKMPLADLAGGRGVGDALAPPKFIMVAWDIKRGLKSLKLGDITGRAKGTQVPQLDQGGSKLLKRLDSTECADVVERLIRPSPAANVEEPTSAMDPSEMSVAELKQAIAAAGLSFHDCAEKADLISRARQAMSASRLGARPH